MSKQGAQHGLVPRLRFPGFEEDWQTKRLGDIAEIFKGKGISKADISADGTYPCIRYGELYTIYGEVITEVASKTLLPAEALYFGESNDVIIPSSGETKEDIAKAACVVPAGIALGGDLNVIRSPEVGIFLSYYLNGPLRKNISRVAQGDSVVHLYPHQLEKLFVRFPSRPEQQRIADCLSSADACISEESRRLDALKAHKQSLMQQLFPSEGEPTPRLRFPRFRTSGNWIRRKLSGLVAKYVNSVEVVVNETYHQIGIRSHGKGIFHKNLVRGKALGNKRVFWVPERALVVNIVFAWEQAVAVTSAAERGMIASHRFPMYLGLPDGADVDFLKYFFLTSKGKELLGIASPGGAGRNKTLGQKDFENLDLLLPKTIEEQIAIANFLSTIDGHISLQSQKIAKLHQHKKGLMQGLFQAINASVA